MVTRDGQSVRLTSGDKITIASILAGIAIALGVPLISVGLSMKERLAVVEYKLETMTEAFVANEDKAAHEREKLEAQIRDINNQLIELRTQLAVQKLPRPEPIPRPNK